MATIAPLHADGLNPPAFALECADTGTVVLSEGSLSCNGGSVSSVSDPSAETTNNFSVSDPVSFVGGTAELSFDVGVTGGAVGDAVPVLVDYSIFANSLGESDADSTDANSSVSLNFANGNSGDNATLDCSNVLDGGTCPQTSLSGVLSATASQGEDNIVELLSNTQIYGTGFAQTNAEVTSVFIDPDFAAQNPEYSLELNVLTPESGPDAPEPATWLLGLAGLGIAAGIRRKVKA